MSEVILKDVFSTLIHSMACLHSMLDPQHTWMNYFIPGSLVSEWDRKGGPQVVPVPDTVLSLYEAVFTADRLPLHFRSSLQLFFDLKTELLHLMGALLSSVEVYMYILLFFVYCV